MRLNDKLTELLEKLNNIMLKKGEPMRARAYKKAQETIYNIDEDITDLEQLKDKPYIGKIIMEKFETYLKEGKLKLIEDFENRPENILSDVYGIGPKKAQDLVKEGVDSIRKLKNRQDELLNDKQKIGLKYYEDILKRIPRNEIKLYEKVFEKSFINVANKQSKFEIVGSYRRGATDSGDIDVIFTSDNVDIFNLFLDDLINNNIIIEVLSRGDHKSLVIAKLNNNSVARRVDFLFTTNKEYPFALLYFTGSKSFNTVMRGFALKKGLSLNEHGFHKKHGGKKEEKMDLNIYNETDIFDYLKLEYKTPEERINGTALVPIDKTIFNNFTKNISKTKRKHKKSPNKTKKKEKSIEKTQENEDLYQKYKKMNGQQLRDELSELLNLPKGKKSSGKLTTKNAIINKIIEIRNQNISKIVKTINSSPSPSKTKKKTPIQSNKKTKKNINKSKDNKLMAPKKNKFTSANVIKMMNKFKENGVNYLDTLNKNELEAIIKVANKEFHSYLEKQSNVTLTDGEFDIIREYLSGKYPNSDVLNDTGAEFDKNKVDLPVNMPSMNKIKPTTDSVSEWKKKYKGPYILSCKLDGVSGLYYSMNGERKLYTRGNGSVGQDVSHLLKYVNGLPNKMDVIVRGEFIIKKNKFDTKYKSDFSNARNLVAGIVNKKKGDLKAKDIDFISYELIEPNVKPSEQMKFINDFGFKVVKNSNSSDINNDTLSQTLIDYRNNYDYIIDGVIVSDDDIYERKNKNPDHAFAFKMVLSDQVAESMVLDVIWNPSKSGYLKPRVRITPVNIGGANIEYATGFNGKFIEENKIGIGATIQIIRSGDVIPHIKSVTIPADKPKMPDVAYTWTDTHVDIILSNKDDDINVLSKNMTAFFTSLDVDNLSEGNVNRLISAGYNSIPKVLHMKLDDFKNVDGFKDKLSKKIHDGIHDKVNNASLLQIAAASNKLGRGIGERKIKPVLDKYPDFFTRTETADEKKNMLISVNGIGKENAEAIVSNTPSFLEFLQLCDLSNKLNEKPKTVENILISDEAKSHPLYNKKIVMTKVRDKEIIEYLKIFSASLVDTVKLDTFALIVKSKSDKSNKITKAEELKIQIMTPDEFKENYMK
jgi:NAD-dependent DNA ligase/DNA polymerase/3'-5' exonuclease PolX